VTPDEQDTQTGAHRDPAEDRSCHDAALSLARRMVRQNHILREIAGERDRQDAKWGLQHHDDGTDEGFGFVADVMRRRCELAASRGQVTWRHILLEEVYESFAERDTARLRAELVQVAAVAVNWIEDIDSRA